MSDPTARPSRETGRSSSASLGVRILVIVGVLALCAWALFDNHRETGSPVRLGLDLQGGMHLVLEIDDPAGALSAQERAEAISQARLIIAHRVDGLGVAEPLLQVVGRDRLIVELAGVAEPERARELIGRTALLEWRMVLPASRAAAALSRVDETAAALGAGDGEAALSRLVHRWPGSEELLVAEEDVARARAILELHEVRDAMPRGTELRWGWEPLAVEGRLYRVLHAVESEAFLTGEMLEDARSGRDPEFNRPLVHFELSRMGGRIFDDMTGRHVGERMAILLDGEVVSAPEIRMRIGAQGVIQLDGATLAEARDLAMVLRAGALPAPLRIMEERTVGPALGQDSIDRGRTAGAVGLALLVLVMVAYYRFAGVLAVTALAVYVVVLLGGLAALDRTLTLPGLAGIILSIGMAVDANVLIFERIREELAAGRPARAAVDRGFAHARSAIVDANATTLITALILFQFGTGPVRGFAVTLSMGIVASFFTALRVTRTLFTLYLRARRKAAVGLSI